MRHRLLWGRPRTNWVAPTHCGAINPPMAAGGAAGTVTLERPEEAPRRPGTGLAIGARRRAPGARGRPTTARRRRSVPRLCPTGAPAVGRRRRGRSGGRRRADASCARRWNARERLSGAGGTRQRRRVSRAAASRTCARQRPDKGRQGAADVRRGRLSSGPHPGTAGLSGPLKGATGRSMGGRARARGRWLT